jgi:hypothetical protein
VFRVIDNERNILPCFPHFRAKLNVETSPFQDFFIGAYQYSALFNMQEEDLWSHITWFPGV